MRVAALALALALAAPVAAQTPPATEPECFPLAPGCERLPRLFDDLADELGPLLERFGTDLAVRLHPYLAELQRLLGDLSGWEAPEVLPNGDILIRRRPPAPEARPPQSESDEALPPGEPLEL